MEDFSGILAAFNSTPSAEERRQAANAALTRIGLGILSGNQPSTMPRNQLGVLAQGGMAGSDAYQNSIDKQMGDRKQNAALALQALQIKKQMDQQAALQGLVSGSQPGAAPGGPGGSPGVLSNGAQPGPQGMAPQGYRPIPLDKLAQAAVGGVNIDPFLKLNEHAQPKLENVSGIGMVNPYTAQIISSMPRVTESGRAAGVVPNGQGGWSVSVPQNSMEAYKGFQRADESAKAEFDPFLGQVDSSGRPIPQTRMQFVEGRGGAEGMGPTISEKSASESIGKSDAERVASLEQKIPSLASVSRRLDRMQALTANATTYAASGAELKSQLGNIAQGFGLSINKDKTANTEEYLAHVAELLKDRLASKDYGSGSGVSNLDLISAQKPLPELAKTPQGRQQIIEAIRADSTRAMSDAVAARDYFGENKSLRGFKYPSELEKSAPKEKAFPSPSKDAINRLRMNPKERDQFEAIFGPGSSTSYAR